MLKKCAAQYSMSKGKLDKVVGEAIVQAADEVRRWPGQSINVVAFSTLRSPSLAGITRPTRRVLGPSSVFAAVSDAPDGLPPKTLL